jgi:hypothetical protein
MRLFLKLEQTNAFVVAQHGKYSRLTNTRLMTVDDRGGLRLLVGQLASPQNNAREHDDETQNHHRKQHRIQQDGC